jgi:hypothetical protein
MQGIRSQRGGRWGTETPHHLCAILERVDRLPENGRVPLEGVRLGLVDDALEPGYELPHDGFDVVQPPVELLPTAIGCAKCVS